MKKILLCCAAGMSTSMLVNKMLDYAKSQNLDVKIDAVGVSEFEDAITRYECCLLGPQIKYKLTDFSRIAGADNKPVAVINTIDYGMMNAEKVLKQAFALLV